MRVHPDFCAAVTMLTPLIASLVWCFTDHLPNPAGTYISAFGCILHFPFSAVLHLYRAFGKNPITRTFLYKIDVTFILLHTLLGGYAWNLEISKVELAYYVLSILYLWSIDPLKHPATKRNVDVLSAVGVVLGSFGLLHRSAVFYAIALIVWTVAFSIYTMKLLGDHSSTIFHFLLGVPQYILLMGLNLPAHQWWHLRFTTEQTKEQAQKLTNSITLIF